MERCTRQSCARCTGSQKSIGNIKVSQYFLDYLYTQILLTLSKLQDIKCAVNKNYINYLCIHLNISHVIDIE